MPPTAAPMRFSANATFRVRDGKLYRWWQDWSALAILRQIHPDPLDVLRQQARKQQIQSVGELLAKLLSANRAWSGLDLGRALVDEFYGEEAPHSVNQDAQNPLHTSDSALPDDILPHLLTSLDPRMLDKPETLMKASTWIVNSLDSIASIANETKRVFVNTRREAFLREANGVSIHPPKSPPVDDGQEAVDT